MALPSVSAKRMRAKLCGDLSAGWNCANVGDCRARKRLLSERRAHSDSRARKAPGGGACERLGAGGAKHRACQRAKFPLDKRAFLSIVIVRRSLSFLAHTRDEKRISQQYTLGVRSSRGLRHSLALARGTTLRRRALGASDCMSSASGLTSSPRFQLGSLGKGQRSAVRHLLRFKPSQAQRKRMQRQANGASAPLELCASADV